MLQPGVGRVLALAVRHAARAPMQELDAVHTWVEGTLEGNAPVRIERGVSFLSQEQWDEVNGELGASLPWHTRRANVLVQGISLAETIGKTLCVGMVEVVIHAETKPCALMDQLHLGLRRALVPNCRGGVHGRIIKEGTIRVGDPVSVKQ